MSTDDFLDGIVTGREEKSRFTGGTTPRDRFNPNRLDLADLQAEAEMILGEQLPGRVAEEERPAWVDAWLRWSQREDSETRKRWAYLASAKEPSSGKLKKHVDRDAFVLALWKTVASLDHPNRVAIDFIQKRVHFEFYQTHFFGWFLSRFDLRAARSVFIEPRQATRLHGLLVTILAAVPWLSLGLWTTRLSLSLAVFVALLVFVSLVGVYVREKGLPWYAYFNSLSPRLGAAVGIGYLFFFSAPQLVKILNDTWRPAWQLGLGVLALVVTAFGYLAFHVSRRVHPRLQQKVLVRRSGAILALAIAYSSLGVLVAGPMLFSQTFFHGAGYSGEVHAYFLRLAFCAAVALNLGVVLQLAWDEKPLTEPL